jgi:hypothetical protein
MISSPAPASAGSATQSSAAASAWAGKWRTSAARNRVSDPRREVEDARIGDQGHLLHPALVRAHEPDVGEKAAEIGPAGEAGGVDDETDRAVRGEGVEAGAEGFEIAAGERSRRLEDQGAAGVVFGNLEHRVLLLAPQHSLLSEGR